MTNRTFVHSSGRSLQVRKGTRIERLVEGDDNWTETKPKPANTKEASDAGDSGGRGGVAGEKSDGDGGKPRRRSSRKG